MWYQTYQYGTESIGEFEINFLADVQGKEINEVEAKVDGLRRVLVLKIEKKDSSSVRYTYVRLLSFLLAALEISR